MARKVKEPETVYPPSAALGLANISDSGQAPKTRLTDAKKALDIAERLIDADSKQEEVDASIYHMITGCPPYSSALLKRHAQSWRSNCPSRISNAYLNTALTQFWDVVASAKPKCQISLDPMAVGDPEKAKAWSDVISEEFERLNEKDQDLNFMFQRSQWDMVLYGYGPVMWMDKLDYRAKAIPKQNLHVPKNSKSNVSEWDIAVVQVPYRLDEIYSYISGEGAAGRGWNKQEGIRAIQEATPKAIQDKLGGGWMALEQAIRQNDLWYSENSEEIVVDWVFVREFDGRITKGGVVNGKGAPDWLYHNIGEYDDWHQALAPMYLNVGDGTHYGVKGLGVECYPILSVFDRLQNQIIDSAFHASSMHFKSNGGTELEEQSIVAMGPYVLHKTAMEYIQTAQLGPGLESAIMAKRDLLDTLTANLAQFRPAMRDKGNPPTARQVDFEAENLNTIGRSQITRYWDQLDVFWTERYRRAINSSLTDSVPGGKEAKEFQDRCGKRGVPEKVLEKATVKSTRTIGFGNNDARRQALERGLARLPLYNETGRRALLEDITISDFGYTAAQRYCPPSGELGPDEKEQEAEAQQNVASMKVGVPPVVTPKQNPYIHATTYLKAIGQSAASLQQGANQGEVYNFLACAIPATQAQMQRMANDPTRKAVLQDMEKQLQQAIQIFKGLQGRLQQQAKAQQQQQMQAMQRQQQMTVDQQIKARESQMNMARKDQEAQHRMDLKSQQTAQKLETTRVTTEQKLRINDLNSAANIELKKREQDEKPQTPAHGNK